MSLENFDWSKHAHIGLDLDDTLVSSMQKWIDALHKKWKFLFLKSIEDFSHFDASKIPGCDMSKEELMLFWADQNLENSLSIENSEVWIKLLKNQNKKLSIITARNEEDHKKDTYEWLEKHFPQISRNNIFFANHTKREFRKKSEICKEIWVTLMIDDGMHNAEDLVENNIPCILLEKPWNRDSDFSHPLLYKVKDWSEIIESLKKYE